MTSGKPIGSTFFLLFSISIFFNSLIWSGPVIDFKSEFHNIKSTLEADTVYVDDDYNSGTPGWGIYCFDSIQNGIFAVDSGGVINVYNGVYYESIVISKRINLVGENKDSTIINGNGAGNVVLISSDSTIIKGFTIKGGNDSGLRLNSDYNTITGNIFRSNYEVAILVYETDSNTISYNDFQSNGDIMIDNSNFNYFYQNSFNGASLVLYPFCSYNIVSENNFTMNCGIIVMMSNYNSFINNTITNGSGVYLDHSEYNLISNNLISDNAIGINGHAANYNTICENIICGSTNKGIYLPDCMCGGCKFNNIFHNNWINNGQHAYDECINYWDDGYPSGGNYWDDYSGVDNFSGPNQNIPGSDSIGDSYYNIAGGTEKDFYPLMLPFGMPDLAKIAYVDDDYNENTPGWGYDHFASVSLAVNLVANNGLVNVLEGVFFENLSINKKIVLNGINKIVSIIDGGGKSTIIYITSDSVEIRNLTIQHSGSYDAGIYLDQANIVLIKSNQVVNCYNGIVLDNCTLIRTICNDVENCSSTGISISHSNHCKFIQNTSRNNRIGIGIWNDSDYNTISGSSITNNSWDGGIYLSNASSNEISNNFIQNNDDNGIYIGNNSNSNKISNNIIANSFEFGVKTSSSNYNRIVHNVFSGNVLGNAFDICTNIWNSGYSSPFNPETDGGNYWNDYSGHDNFSGSGQNQTGSDGIGDTPYLIPGGSNFDAYPFMNQNGWNLILDLRVFIEGAFCNNEIIPPLNNNDLIPISQPYNDIPWSYNGTESVTGIPNPGIIDWILVELRDTTQAEFATEESIVHRQAGFLLNDGSIVSLDGHSKLLISHTVKNNLFAVVRHRNHLSIMSAYTLVKTGNTYSYDFTYSAEQAYLSNQKELSPGIWGMIAGDADANGFIDSTDVSVFWKNQAAKMGYYSGDMNLDCQVDNNDKNEYWLPNLGAGSQVP